MVKKLALYLLLFVVAGQACFAAPARTDSSLNDMLRRAKGMAPQSRYPWKIDIITTFFWIGNNRNSYNSTVNYDSAWDGRWYENYGGNDDPSNRKGYRPRNFFPNLNPFYYALPFNDLVYPAKAERFIPWFKRDYVDRRTSVCKGKWIAIHHNGRFCFAQWEDVGPFRTDNAEYIWGNGKPNTPSGAGLDVSPAVRDYLGLSGRDYCDWRFVEEKEVPEGPWIKYGEIALIQQLIKEAKGKGKSLPRGAINYKPEG
jgi:hypothetical protein